MQEPASRNQLGIFP